VPALHYDLAVPADDETLRRHLRHNAIPGNVTVTYEREPNYFRASGVEGPIHQTLVARDAGTGRVLGLANRSVRDLYLNGERRPVGYMSQLRVDPAFPWGLSLARAVAGGFEFFHQLHADGRAPFYLVSIITGNHPARRLLNASLRGMPRLTEYTNFHTYAIALGRSLKAPALPGGLRLARGTAAQTQAIAGCLARNGARYQFAPHWTADTLFGADSAPDLAPENFILVMAGEHIAGCAAVWDQSGFKQTVVRGYAGLLRHWRGALNFGARLAGWPPLPGIGAPIRHCFASHLAVDGDDPAVAAALLRAAYTAARTRGFSYMMLGLAEAHPFRALARSYWHILYPSQIYLAAWDDGAEAVRQIDRRVPGLEAAIL
jgi:hypothetical protein